VVLKPIISHRAPAGPSPTFFQSPRERAVEVVGQEKGREQSRGLAAKLAVAGGRTARLHLEPAVHANRHCDEVRDVLAETILGAHIELLRLVQQV
jgi:hypothetical protein